MKNNMNEEDILKRLNSTVGLGRGTLLKLQGKFESYTNLKNAIEEDPSCLLSIDTIGNTIAERIIDAVLKEEENKTADQLIEDISNQEVNNEQLKEDIGNHTDNNTNQEFSVEEFFDHIENLLKGWLPKKSINDIGLSHGDLEVYDIYYNNDFILISVKLLLDKIFNGNTYNLDKTLDCIPDSIIYKNNVKKGNSIVRYSFSTYSNITGNFNKYVKIFIEPLEDFLNKRIYINRYPVGKPNIDKFNNPLNAAEKTMQIKKNYKQTIMIDFCKKLMEDSKYICSFSCFVKEYENSDKMEFKSVIRNIGTYIFDINNIDHGQWLFDDKYKDTVMIYRIKSTVLSLLHEHKKESDSDGIC